MNRHALIIILGILMNGLVLFVAPLSFGTEAVEFDGLIEPYLVVEVGSEVAGIIDNVTVDRGDMVEAGQVVAMLRSGVEKTTMELARARAEMEAAIKSKKAALEFAERNKQRINDLYEQKALPFHEWDEVETQRLLAGLELAEALENKQLDELEYKRAAEVFERKTIFSPVSGVVVERYLYKGEYVEDQPILKIAQIDPLNVEVIIPVDMFGSIKVGMRATVKPEAPITGFYDATVTIVDKVFDAASGTFGVRLELPNPESQLPPGLKCKVIFHDKEL